MAHKRQLSRPAARGGRARRHGRLRLNHGLRKLHLVLDAFTLASAMALTLFLHGHLRAVWPQLKALPHPSSYAALALLAFPLWLVLAAAMDLHSTFERARSLGALVADLVKLHLAGFVCLAVAQFLTQTAINRSATLLLMGCSLGLMFVERLALRGWARYQHGRGHGQQRLLIVGQPSGRMADFIRDVRGEPLAPALVGVLQPLVSDGDLSLPPPRGLDDVPILGTVGDLSRVLHEHPVDHVMFFPPCNRAEALTDALAVCEALGVTANFSVNLVQLAQARPRVASFCRHPFVSFDVAPKSPEALAVKHGLDFVVAGLLVVAGLPLLLLIALAVRVSMGRPVLFSQARAGRNGRPFRMWKFRTMRPGAEAERASLETLNEMQGPVFKATADPRVTRLGRLLRASSLDELPQLFNVLAGTMSLVGPRPLPLPEQAQIRGWQRRRLSMRPGITGLWQVSGRNDLDFEEWMLLDLQYIDEWSLALDFTLLLKTGPAVLSRRGAR